MKELFEVLIAGSGFYAIAVFVGYRRGVAWGIEASREIMLSLVERGEP